MAHTYGERADIHRGGQAQDAPMSGPSRPRMFDMFADSRTFNPTSYATLLQRKSARDSDPAISPLDSPRRTPSNIQRPAIRSSSSDLPLREPDRRTTVASPRTPRSAGSLRADISRGAGNGSAVYSQSSARANTGRGLQYKRLRPSPIDTTRVSKRLRLQPTPLGTAGEATSSRTRGWGPEATAGSEQPTASAHGAGNMCPGPLVDGDSNGPRRSRDLGGSSSRIPQGQSPSSGPEHAVDATPKLPSPNSSASRRDQLGRPRDASAQVRKWPGVRPRGHDYSRDAAPSPVRQWPSSSLSDERAPRREEAVVEVRIRKWPGTSSTDSRVRRGAASDTRSHLLGQLGRDGHKEPTGEPDTRGCYYCQRPLLIGVRYRCSHCSIELCQSCNINATLIHPGHAFGQVSPAGDGDLEDSRERVSGTNCCHTCHSKLTGVWYECEDCFDTVYSCDSCRRGHDPEHTFRTISGRSLLADATEEPCNGQGNASGNASDVGAGAEEGSSGEGGSSGDQDSGREVIEIEDSSEEDDVGEGPSYDDGNLGDEHDGAIAADADGGHATALTDGRVLRRTRQNTLNVSSLLSYDADRDTVSFSRDSFLQLSNIVKAAFELAEKAMGVQGGTAHVQDSAHSGKKLNMDLLNFDHLDLDVNLDPALQAGPSEQGSVRTRRPWLPEDRERLRRLKEEGWADEQIARKLNRSCSAVTQQWRKQKAGQL